MTTTAVRNAICAAILLTLAASGALAQGNDWRAVESLAPGTIISVKAQHRYLCIVNSVTPDQLVCDIKRVRFLALPPTIAFRREEILEVRRERNQNKDMRIGAGIGGAAGAAAGTAAAGRDSRPLGALFGGAGGALAGAVVGGSVAIFAHGKVIYRR